MWGRVSSSRVLTQQPLVLYYYGTYAKTDGEVSTDHGYMADIMGLEFGERNEYK